MSSTGGRLGALALAGLVVACGWASIEKLRFFACYPDGSCPDGLVCRTVESGDGERACVRPGEKPVSDGGLERSDGGATLRDGGFVFEDGGRPVSGGADAGLDGGTDAGVDGGPDGGTEPAACGDLRWDFDGGVAVVGYPENFANYNPFFVTTDRFLADFGASDGGLGGFDGGNGICRNIARDAGLWSAGTYVAYLSVQLDDGGYRIRTDAGFIRLDGLPIAPSLEAMRAGRLWYPPAINERGTVLSPGTPINPSTAWTGADYLQPGGPEPRPLVGGNCLDWTRATAGLPLGQVGDPFSSSFWAISKLGGASCAATHSLYCAQTAGRCAPLAPQAPPGARLALASVEVPWQLVESVCHSYSVDAGGVRFRPLIAHNGKTFNASWTSDAGVVPAIDFNGPVWVRPDGVAIVRTPMHLLDDTLLAPIDMFVTDAGASHLTSYDERLFWIGTTGPGAAGTAAATCDDWSDGGSTAQFGFAFSANKWFDGRGVNQTCDNSGVHRVYCVQE